jgi:hypothetical protein
MSAVALHPKYKQANVVQALLSLGKSEGKSYPLELIVSYIGHRDFQPIFTSNTPIGRVFKKYGAGYRPEEGTDANSTDDTLIYNFPDAQEKIIKLLFNNPAIAPVHREDAFVRLMTSFVDVSGVSLLEAAKANDESVVVTFIQAGLRASQEVLLVAVTKKFAIHTLEILLKAGAKIDATIAEAAVDSGCLFIVRKFYSPQNKPSSYLAPAAWKNREVFDYLKECGFVGEMPIDLSQSALICVEGSTGETTSEEGSAASTAAAPAAAAAAVGPLAK